MRIDLRECLRESVRVRACVYVHARVFFRALCAHFFAYVLLLVYTQSSRSQLVNRKSETTVLVALHPSSCPLSIFPSFFVFTFDRAEFYISCSHWKGS